MPFAACFVAQTHPLGCVAACVAILRRRRGLAADEASIRAEWGHPPFTLLHGAGDGVYRQLDPDDATDHELLRGHLEQSWIVVLTMFESRRPAHAIVLVAFSSGTYSYLDPAKPASAQPLQMTEDTFARVWTGAMLIAAP